MSEKTLKNLAVFVSGSGTNLENIALHIKKGLLKNCRIQLVVCDQPKALALERARLYNLESVVIQREKFSNKADFEIAILKELDKRCIDYIVLAGYMRILGKTILDKFPWKIINIHPARPKQFPGSHAIQDFWNFRPRLTTTAATIHFVDSGIDTGPVIKEMEVVRKLGETIQELEKKIHQAEYELYPQAIQLLVDEKLLIENGRVKIL